MTVYLDYAATAPVKTEVKQAIEPYLADYFGNPSSIHQWGRAGRAAVDKSREIIAQFLNCQPAEIVFTSGGTEADNLAILGLARRFVKPHIISTAIEHHAVLNTVKYLQNTKLAEITLLKPNSEGLITASQVQKAIRKNTVLVSVMYVNNEIGMVQPIRDIGKMLESVNRQRSTCLAEPRRTVNDQRIFFHTDAVQAAEYQPMDVDFLHVDMLTISGHKIGAPKGIGALYIRKNTPISSIMFGGEQERNLRPGTENVAGIVALGKASDILAAQKAAKRIKKTQTLRDYFTSRILKEIPEVMLNGSLKQRSPNNVNFYFKYIEGESILLNLDLVGIAASSGSACTSQSLQPSHVLMAVYDEAERAHGSIRFTLGEATTKKELDYTVGQLKKIVQKLRDISPLYVKKGKNE